MQVVRRILFVLLLVIPLHTLVIYNLAPRLTGMPQELIAAWKEALLGTAVVVASALALSTRTLQKLDPLDGCAAALLLVVLAQTAMAENVYAAAAASRMLVVPVLAFYVARRVHLADGDLFAWMRLFFAVGVCIAAWGIFQALVLGQDFFTSLDYESYDGSLGTSFYISGFDFQRAVGTLSSPLLFGSYCQLVLAIGFALHGLSSSLREKHAILCGLALVLAGLILSFTRSAWIATGLSAAVYLAVERRFKMLLKLLLWGPAAAGAALFLVSLFDPIYVDALVSHVIGTVTLTDPSSLGHVESLRSGWQQLLASPLGHGLGASGPRSVLYGTGDLLVENSYLVVGLDNGLVGFALFVAFVFLVARRMRGSMRLPGSESRRVLKRAMFSAFVAHLLVTWNLLPELVDAELSLYMFGIVGLLSGAAGDAAARTSRSRLFAGGARRPRAPQDAAGGCR